MGKSFLKVKISMKKVNLNLGGGSLLQLENRSHSQMMSYVLQAPEGQIIVIDGGYSEEDAACLYDVLKGHGGHVAMWLFTHGHEDHIGSLMRLLERPDFDLEIDGIYYNFPPTEWFGRFERGAMGYVERLRKQLELRKLPVTTVHTGDCFDCGGLSIAVLSDPSYYESIESEINASTVVWKVKYPNRDVLFLGDLNVEGQIELLRHVDASRLRCDVVQTAHHGQHGVDRSFYELIRPKVCLWTAPLWLWNNDKGNGFNTGPYETVATRRWMEELGVKENYPICDGDYLFY